MICKNIQPCEVLTDNGTSAKEIFMSNANTLASTKNKTVMLTTMGLLTAIVVVLQAMAIAIRFGVFNITLVLVPIVVGAAIYGC